MSDQPQPVPRWPIWLQAVVGTLGAIVAIGGLLIVIGQFTNRVAVLEQDMIIVKANQATYIPILVGMQTDIKYLADARRREDRHSEPVR